MQDICTAALVRAKQLSHCSVLLCKIASQHACATAITPMELCPSYRCALMQDICTAALVRAKQLPHCSVLLCKPASQHACATAITYGDLPCIQVCSDSNPMHCSTGQGKTASRQFSAALQTSLTACLCHCNHTYGDLPFIQVCKPNALMQTASPLFMHCSTGQICPCKCNTNAAPQNKLPTVQCCSANQAQSMLVSLQLHLWRFALHTAVQ